MTKGLPANYDAPANEWYQWKPSPRLNKNVRVLVTSDPSNYPIGVKDVITSGDMPVVWTNTKYKMIYMNRATAKRFLETQRKTSCSKTRYSGSEASSRGRDKDGSNEDSRVAILLYAVAIGARCFAQGPADPSAKKHLLVIGEEKGYRHDAVSHAMATIERLGRESGLWDTTIRTDTEALTKKKFEFNAKNLNDFDAVLFYTGGELEMNPEQKAALLSFVHDDGKGFIGVHSATITFTEWPEYGEMIGRIFRRASLGHL